MWHKNLCMITWQDRSVSYHIVVFCVLSVQCTPPLPECEWKYDIAKYVFISSYMQQRKNFCVQTRKNQKSGCVWKCFHAQKVAEHVLNETSVKWNGRRRNTVKLYQSRSNSISSFWLCCWDFCIRSWRDGFAIPLTEATRIKREIFVGKMKNINR